jgi:peptidyl-prolyl cis-trans isomerase C
MLRVSGLAVAALGLAAAAFAQSPDAKPVAKVGSGIVSLSEARARLREVPRFQLRTLGDSPSAIRHAFLEELISMELVVQGARADKLDELPEVREKILVRLKDALLENLQREIESEAISDDAIKAYFEKNRAQYAPQTRLKLWRIVVKTRAEAEQILQTIKTDSEYKKDPLAGWEKLASERSIDRTTAMRRGNLGFVQADGATPQQDVRVNPALFKAALAVADGEVVPEPIEDEGLWVVLQRRGSHVTPERRLETEAGTIRSVLAKQRVRERIGALVDGLRKKHVSEVNVQLLEQLEISREGDIGPRSRPGTLPRKSHPAAASPKPQGIPGEFR